MPDRIFWSALSRFHDWSDKKFPVRMLSQALEVKAIGPVEWVSVQNGQRRSIRIDDFDHFAERLFELAKPDPKHKIISLQAGGTSPAPWTITAHLPPFVASEKRAWGYGAISLLFDPAVFATVERSTELIHAFLHTHTPDDTEYACIHPYARLQVLRNTIYKTPVTFTPMLAGIFWTNFLGPGQLDLFDIGRLKALKTYRVEWIDDRGLFVIVTPDLADVERPETEKEMERVTFEFRGALK